MTLVGLLLGFVLIGATVVIHYEALRATAGLIPRLDMAPRARILVVIAGVFVAHFLEVALYAAAIGGLDGVLGSVSGSIESNALDYFYLSLTSYTTLGIGDIYPTGALRIVIAMESLNGLVLIGWSASFTYLAMQQFWDAHRRAQARRR